MNVDAFSGGWPRNEDQCMETRSRAYQSSDILLDPKSYDAGFPNWTSKTSSIYFPVLAINTGPISMVKIIYTPALKDVYVGAGNLLRASSGFKV